MSKEIELSKKANDIYCLLQNEFDELSDENEMINKSLKYYQERCRLAENIILAEKEGMSISLAWTEYYEFIHNVKHPEL